jgi:hypothetical protein
VFLLALAVGLVALLVPGVLGAVLLLAVVAALAVLLRLTWPVTPPLTRWLRLVVLVLLTVIAVTKLAVT